MLVQGSKPFFALCVAVLYGVDYFNSCQGASDNDNCICDDEGKRWHP